MIIPIGRRKGQLEVITAPVAGQIVGFIVLHLRVFIGQLHGLDRRTVIEGMVLGLVAGGLAFLAEWGLYTELYNVAGTVSLSSFHLLSFDVLRWWVLGVYCGAGALFGIGGSVTSIRKFMDV